MKQLQVQRFCPVCDRNVMALKKSPSHLIHILMTLLTAGVWLIIWVLVILCAASEKSFCGRCGSKTKSPISNKAMQAKKAKKYILPCGIDKFSSKEEKREYRLGNLLDSALFDWDAEEDDR